MLLGVEGKNSEEMGGTEWEDKSKQSSTIEERVEGGNGNA